MPITQQQVNEAIKELGEAMTESVEAQKAEENAKLRRIKAHKRLLLAKGVVASLKFNL